MTSARLNVTMGGGDGVGLGEIKIPFGEGLRGRTLAEVDMDKLDFLLMWMERKGLHKAWKYREFYEAAAKWLEEKGHGAAQDHRRTL